jgi:hypothetical protein
VGRGAARRRFPFVRSWPCSFAVRDAEHAAAVSKCLCQVKLCSILPSTNIWQPSLTLPGGLVWGSRRPGRASARIPVSMSITSVVTRHQVKLQGRGLAGRVNSQDGWSQLGESKQLLNRVDTAPDSGRPPRCEHGEENLARPRLIRSMRRKPEILVTALVLGGRPLRKGARQTGRANGEILEVFSNGEA